MWPYPLVSGASNCQQADTVLMLETHQYFLRFAHWIYKPFSNIYPPYQHVHKMLDMCSPLWKKRQSISFKWRAQLWLVDVICLHQDFGCRLTLKWHLSPEAKTLIATFVLHMAASDLAFFTQTECIRNCAHTLKGEDKQTHTFIHESSHMHSGARRPLAFQQHESAFMFTAEQTEEGFTSCVYLEYASFHDCLPS